MILFAYLCIIKQIVYQPVRDSVISFALTVMFVYQREVLLFLHIMEKKKTNRCGCLALKLGLAVRLVLGKG